MNKQLQKMNLIDLLSEKHLALRKIVTDKDRIKLIRPNPTFLQFLRPEKCYRSQKSVE